MKNLLKITDLSPAQIQKTLDLSQALEKKPQPLLKGKNILFAFEKPSLRTKVGTEVAINKLGGSVIQVEASSFFSGKILHAGETDPSGSRENLIDTVKNVSQWCDGIFARVFDHKTLQQLETYSSIPVVNALCDQHHPMQAFADFLTIQQTFEENPRPTITFVGDANNVAYSLIEMGLKLGYPMKFTGPKDHYWNDIQIQHFESLAQKHQGRFKHSHNPESIIPDSNILYTDTFVSMGEENQHEAKIKAFENFQVNQKMIDLSGPKTYFMHCLPAHRNIEVTDEVIDSPNSLVYLQAKNRMVSSLGVFTTLIK